MWQERNSGTGQLRNPLGYFALYEAIFVTDPSNPSHPTLNPDNDKILRAYRMTPGAWPKLANALDAALDSLEVADDLINARLAERTAMAIKLRYSLYEPGDRLVSYGAVGDVLPRHSKGGELLNPQGGVSAQRARLIVLRGIGQLRKNSMIDPVRGFRYHPHPQAS